MEEKTKEVKKKNISIGELIVIILLIALVIASVYCVKLEKEIKLSRTQTSDTVATEVLVKKINLIDNIFSSDLYGEDIGTGFELPYEMIYESDNKSYYGTYTYTGENKGKIIINDKEIISSDKIKMVCACNQYSGAYWDGNENTKKVTSKLYVLFENGEIGYISSDDITNKKYTITKETKYKDIEYFITLGGTNSGIGNCLFAVDTNGKCYEIDWITEGS